MTVPSSPSSNAPVLGTRLHRTVQQNKKSTSKEATRDSIKWNVAAGTRAVRPLYRTRTYGPGQRRAEQDSPASDKTKFSSQARHVDCECYFL